MIRVVLPQHLRTLSRTGAEITVEVSGAATVDSVLAAVEQRYPMLAGTIRDRGTGKRRPFVRYFVCGEDVSLLPTGSALPSAVANGKEPFLVIGAIAGG